MQVSGRVRRRGRACAARPARGVLVTAGVLGALLSGCGGAADDESSESSAPRAVATDGGGGEQPSPSVEGSLTDLLLVEGDADGLWGVEKDDAAFGADVQRSPADLYPVEPLFLACAPPDRELEPVLRASERNHETAAEGGLNGQVYQTVATGDAEEVDRAFSVLADVASTCVDDGGSPVTVSEVDVGEVGDDRVAVRSSEDQAWYVVIDADAYLVVLSGFGFTTDGASSPELTDDQITTIAGAAEARLP